MTESVKLLATLFGFAIPVFGAYWVWQDANRLKKNGAYVTPGLWVALVFFLWLVSLPIYLYLRRTTWQASMSSPPATQMAAQDPGQHRLIRPSKAELRVLYWVVAIIFAVMLSMYATWVAISRYPIPDSDAINLGLFLFFLIGLIDLVIIGNLILFDLPEGKHIGKLAGIFVSGLLIAAAVGLLTWGIGWFIAGRPWVPKAFYIAVMLFSIIQSWWLRRKSRTPSNPSTTA
jgi:hypothetical protein